MLWGFMQGHMWRSHGQLVNADGKYTEADNMFAGGSCTAAAVAARLRPYAAAAHPRLPSCGGDSPARRRLARAPARP